jgi:antibiotic biosynthesis monooxygenase (ABM) superfamily enzyme
MLRNRVASPIILQISFILTFPVTTSGYISSPESVSVPRESAKEIVISFLDPLNGLLPVIRQLTMGLPILSSSFVGVSIMVLLMMYMIIPLLTKLLRPWLTKKRLF